MRSTLVLVIPFLIISFSIVASDDYSHYLQEVYRDTPIELRVKMFKKNDEKGRKMMEPVMNAEAWALILEDSEIGIEKKMKWFNSLRNKEKIIQKLSLEGELVLFSQLFHGGKFNPKSMAFNKQLYSEFFETVCKLLDAQQSFIFYTSKQIRGISRKDRLKLFHKLNFKRQADIFLYSERSNLLVFDERVEIQNELHGHMKEDAIRLVDKKIGAQKKSCTGLVKLEGKIGVPATPNICKILIEDEIMDPRPSRLCIISSSLNGIGSLNIGNDESHEFMEAMSYMKFSTSAKGFLMDQIKKRLPPLSAKQIHRKKRFKNFRSFFSKLFFRKKETNSVCSNRKTFLNIIQQLANDGIGIVQMINAEKLTTLIDGKKNVIARLFPIDPPRDPGIILRILLEIFYDNPYRTLLLNEQDRMLLKPIFLMALSGEKKPC